MFEEKVYKDLRTRLRIDAMQLDQELIEHPMRLQTVVEYAADALQIRDAAKNALDVQIADTARRLRAGTEEKLSDTKVASLLLLEDDVKVATQELEDARHDLAYWQGLADSYREKGSALKRIAELTISGYLAPNAAYQGRKEEMAAKRRAVLNTR